MGVVHLWPALPQPIALWVFLFWFLMLYPIARDHRFSRWWALLCSAGAAVTLAVLAYALGSPAV